MTIEELKERFSQSSHLKTLCTALLERSNQNIHINGFAGSGDAVFMASCLDQTNDFNLVILNDKEEAAYFANDLEALLSKKKVLFFPSSSRLPYQTEKTENANVLQRAEVLEALSHRKQGLFVITYPEALAEKVASRTALKQNTLEVKNGMELSLDFVNEMLFEYQFERVDFVTQPGEFAIRGGIVDIFSFAHETPYRIEFFGDEVDSIRSFDPASQLSEGKYNKVTIIPNIRNKELITTWSSVVEFMSRQPVVWVHDLVFSLERMQKEFERAEKAYKELESPLNHLSPEELYLNKPQAEKMLESHQMVQFGLRNQGKPDALVEFDQKPQPSFNKNFELLSTDFNNHVKNGYDNVVVASSPKQIERLHAIFEDLEKEKHFTPILLGMHAGFIDHDLKLVVYTDHQIFDRYHRFRLKDGFREAQQRISLKELTNLQKGDYVVHIDHGVGQFAGLVTTDNHGKKQEAIKLVYKDSDVLYISIHALHRISKYTGKEGTEPKINKLGTQAWSKLKNKTKKKIKEVAFDLIKLYAQRKTVQGFAFEPDSYLQTELEASFIYEDTPDQEKATAAFKTDMESEAPMDRLICGDVGFGKTEVAIRAAFKAAVNGKQVAVLVPTTILALQHFKSFTKRLEDFPVTVDYVNRFRSSKQIKETLGKLAEGKVDILIGTHRIVGKDVKFKDIGLLIIDEEQKFGVGVKDKLKTLKANVDTLTLTATPIPRTLQFSLLGARDLSVINTPPPNRQPVQTELHTFNEEVIRDAVQYELQRNGQVFVVNNRVQNLSEVAGMIQRVVPDARVVTAHGQMEGKELEDRMMRFIEGERDVLVATTIIESGLDIPNANTIIITNAHQFGLSDLHQMRGRVGRSNKKAFCYLLSPPISTMTGDARRRLTAISQFSDLGSGFNIAMRDLDIRGAGNLLGGEQSGFISEIGLDMYQKILSEAMNELKENEFKDVFPDQPDDLFIDTQLETDFELLIPVDYVNNVTERLALYKQLAEMEEEGQVNAFKEELIDRFGPLPEEVEDLVQSMRLKWIGKKIGIEKIVLKMNKLICYFPADQNHKYYQSVEFSKVLAYVQKYPERCTMKQKNEKLSVVFSAISELQKALTYLEPMA